MRFFQVLLILSLVVPAILPGQTRPNILFIAIDDLKPVLACYGDLLAHTPNIDRLAARGVVFDSAYVNQAVCGPSRNSLMLGLRPQSTGLYDLGTHFRDIYPDAVTFSQRLMAMGYQAEALGKVYHTSHGNRDDVLSWSVPHWEASGKTYLAPENQDVARGKKGPAFECVEVADDAYHDGKMAEEAVQRLKRFAQVSETPFLLIAGFRKPHLPFCAPKKYWDLYDPADFILPSKRDLPEDAPTFAGSRAGELLPYQGMPKALPLSDAIGLELIHGYYASVSYIDAQVGRLLDTLEAEGLAENTVVLLWGDHGWHLGDHGLWCKHTNYEQATRIPLIFAGPGIAIGQQSGALVETVDIYPTLLEMVDVPIPEDLDGTSLVTLLSDPTLSVKDHVVSVYPRGARIGRALRTERYRLVEWKVPGESPATAELELYDYKLDRDELKNQAAEQPEVVSSLRAILARYPEALPQVKP